MSTPREYFAARAPAAIPEWFVHVEPPKKFPPMPDYMQLDEAHRGIARDWQSDPISDLPEEIAWYGEKVKAHREGKWSWNRLNESARYVQWRWAYADLVLAAQWVAP